ncbi:T9SS type A sorting domain-containing protein [Prevotella sp. HUN102]|uniref:T9SS type A sorting domain-containing protein n=1 Tax=Prevotella sp. HUN102 TaxID=1392486 RepID=UPI00049093F3|nr:T9SS type A sorting domain-containing protein [Prevotella sp. HUN102]
MPHNGVAAIAEGTERIFKGAFAYNKNVKKVIMPNTVTVIDVMNFVDNKELLSVTFSDIKELDTPVTSSVDNIEAGNTEVSVSGNSLTVSSSESTTVVIYDAAGRSVFNSVQTKSATTYLPHGIYVVKVGKTAHKIAI